jgi:DNA modification methylase
MKTRLEHGDMRKVLARLIKTKAKVHAIVTDPPYHLASIVKRFGSKRAQPTKASPAHARAARGFMGQTWDGGGVAFDPATWRLCLELLPPGGYLLAFGGRTTYHRLATAIELAGFEVRDCWPWLYGSGMPKSHNVGKLIDKAKGKTRERAPYNGGIASGTHQLVNGKRHVGMKVSDTPITPEAEKWNGWETQLKPGAELICVARKPLAGTVAANVLKYGTGALNVGACKYPGEDGVPRWPATVAHDGSAEVEGALRLYSPSASRVFYSAKASAADRLGSKHPTVKPVDYMRWLVRMVTPPGGTVLDPFAGSGTTLMACMAEGFDCIMVEKKPGYLADIRRRMKHVRGEDTPLFAKAAA